MPTLLITGANRGLGLELCKQYLDSSWTVHAACRDPESAQELNQLTSQFPESLKIHRLNVANSDQLEALKTKLSDTAIDLLFNNAGIYGADSSQFGSTDTDIWLDTFNVNAIAPLKIIEAFVDNIAKSDLKMIASMSSKMGSITDNTSGSSYAYRSSKTALNSVMQSVSHDLKPLGITALILHPGWVITDMGGPNAELTVEESANSLRKNISNATLEDSGSFYEIDGTIIPW